MPRNLMRDPKASVNSNFDLFCVAILKYHWLSNLKMIEIYDSGRWGAKSKAVADSAWLHHGPFKLSSHPVEAPYASQAVSAHAFNPSTWEEEAGGFLSSRPAWSTKWVSGQPELHRETLSQKKPKKQNKKWPQKGFKKLIHVHMCAMAQVWRSEENLWKLVFCFHHGI